MARSEPRAAGALPMLDRLRVLESAATPAPWRAVLLNDLSDVTYIDGTPLGNPEGKACVGTEDDFAFEDPNLQAQIHADAGARRPVRRET